VAELLNAVVLAMNLQMSRPSHWAIFAETLSRTTVTALEGLARLFAGMRDAKRLLEAFAQTRTLAHPDCFRVSAIWPRRQRQLGQLEEAAASYEEAIEAVAKGSLSAGCTRPSCASTRVDRRQRFRL